uniref:Uncharacterized protein n=1 Tax=Anguilla anguilla TaxID=7936 RepID=A0A0E9QDG0_ANGAN
METRRHTQKFLKHLSARVTPVPVGHMTHKAQRSLGEHGRGLPSLRKLQG